jgi:transposase
MAKRKLTMRKIREILRLKWELKLSNRQVARSVHVSHSTVREYVRRAEQAGLAWPLPEEMGDRELRVRLFPTKQADQKQRPLPDWEKVEQELSRPGVTRMLLWTEYHQEHPEGYGYSQFCELYRQWTKAQAKPVMRLPKKAGEEVQVDYSGLTMGVIDPKTGIEHSVEIFVGVLSASGLIYAEAHPSQRLPDWIAAHGRMFRYFGGVPRLVCPDNLKSGVRSPDFYEPELNPTYQEMAALMSFETWTALPSPGNKPARSSQIAIKFLNMSVSATPKQPARNDATNKQNAGKKRGEAARIGKRLTFWISSFRADFPCTQCVFSLLCTESFVKLHSHVRRCSFVNVLSYYRVFTLDMI